MKFDKSTWIKVKLSDVVTKKEENDRENAHKRFDRFLKVEHMDAESLHIKRWAAQEQGDEINPTFYKIFRKGQILFPTRNPHLRRTALASFDGICGEKTLTLEPNSDAIIPELIPFLFHSESFYAHTTSSIIGSTNPHCRWRDVANYEFLLPPKAQQAEISELLWAMGDVVQKEIYALEKLHSSYQSLVDNLFSIKHKDWSYVALNNVSSINKRSLKSNTDPEYAFRYLDIASIVAPNVIGELSELKFAEAPSRARRVVSNNSIVLSLVRPNQRSFVFVKSGKDVIASTGTGVVDVNEEYNSRFVYHQFFSKKFLQFCQNRMTGTNYPAITPKDLEIYKVAIPNDSTLMKSCSIDLDCFDNAISQSESVLLDSKSLQKSLINQVF